MAKPQAIEVEGLRELNKTIRRATDRDLPKRMGLANKAIGQLVISRLFPRPDPAAVGLGGGTTVRPSASKREVLLRIGGAHRANDSIPKPTQSKNRYALAYWGKRAGPFAFQRRPKRPNIIGTVDSNRREIEKAYLEAIDQAMSGAFAD